MPKLTRPLGKDRPPQELVFQGVKVEDTFPKANLAVSLDSILEAQELALQQEGMPQETLPQDAHAAAPKAALSAPTSQLLEVPVDLIDSPAYQPRLGISDELQERNTTAIAIAGRVNRPILLRAKNDGRYDIIGGSTRLRSVRTLGWPTVPARVVDVDDAEAEILAVSDNEGQTELTDFEKGRAYSRIMATGKIRTVRALAERVGTSAATVTRCLAFMKLHEDCIAFLEDHPDILGSKLISEYVEICLTHPKETLLALIKIEQEGVSQETALRWLRGIATPPGANASARGITQSVFSLGDRGEATLVRRKDSINLKLPKGVDVEAVERAVMQAIMSMDSAG